MGGLRHSASRLILTCANVERSWNVIEYCSCSFTSSWYAWYWSTSAQYNWYKSFHCDQEAPNQTPWNLSRMSIFIVLKHSECLSPLPCCCGRLSVLGAYLDWAKNKAGKSATCNVSQLIKHSLPANSGTNTTRRWKGVRKSKQRKPMEVQEGIPSSVALVNYNFN